MGGMTVLLLIVSVLVLGAITYPIRRRRRR
jgi:hypothetical protein